MSFVDGGLGLRRSAVCLALASGGLALSVPGGGSLQAHAIRADATNCRPSAEYYISY